MIAQIQQIEGWEQLTANEIHSRLGALVLKPDSIYSFNQLVIAFDNVELAETLVGAMRAAGLNASADSLISRGLDFGLQGVQDNIDVLGQRLPDVFTPQWVAALKALGNQTFFASVGGVGDVPTEEEVSAAITEHKKQLVIDTARTLVNSRTTAINAWLDAADLAAYTEAELQAYCDGLMASDDGNGGGA